MYGPMGDLPSRLNTSWQTCGTRTGLLAWAVWVRVGRRGRLGDGPIAMLLLLLLRAVVVRPGDGVVGGRSVLKKGFVVHHLCRPNASSSFLGLCPQLNKLGSRTGQNSSPATCPQFPPGAARR